MCHHHQSTVAASFFFEPFYLFSSRNPSNSQCTLLLHFQRPRSSLELPLLLPNWVDAVSAAVAASSFSEAAVVARVAAPSSELGRCCLGRFDLFPFVLFCCGFESLGDPDKQRKEIEMPQTSSTQFGPLQKYICIVVEFTSRKTIL